jgi:hypothetical protein
VLVSQWWISRAVKTVGQSEAKFNTHDNSVKESIGLECAIDAQNLSK